MFIDTTTRGAWQGTELGNASSLDVPNITLPTIRLQAEKWSKSPRKPEAPSFLEYRQEVRPRPHDPSDFKVQFARIKLRAARHAAPRPAGRPEFGPSGKLDGTGRVGTFAFPQPRPRNKLAKDTAKEWPKERLAA
jgi:hypothetical protein